MPKRDRKYERSEKGKAKQRAWRLSESGKASISKYRRSEERSIVVRRYNNSLKRVLTQRERSISIKLEVLAHYGPNGAVRCSWPGCIETDVDVLTLDHINDDGWKDRRDGRQGTKGISWRGGVLTGIHLRKLGFPPGFQTLCANHQLKKEILRRRKLAEERVK